MPLLQHSVAAPWGAIRFCEAAKPSELDLALAHSIASILDTAIRVKGSACLAVSGGKSPIAMFAALSNANLDWSKVLVTLVDDRWLAPDHPDSNEALVKKYLLHNAASAASFIGLYAAFATPEAGLNSARARLSCLPPVLDVTILGMGNDGHTASLFPCSVEAQAGLDPACPYSVIAVNPQTAPYARISMSLPRIVSTTALFLHIVGDEKKRVLEAALHDKDARSPIVQVLAAGSEVATVYWCPSDA